MKLPELDSETIDRVLEMAWEDRTPFEAIELQFGLSEPQVIAVMRREMKESSFRMWRKRGANVVNTPCHADPKRSGIANRARGEWRYT